MTGWISGPRGAGFVLAASLALSSVRASAQLDAAALERALAASPAGPSWPRAFVNAPPGDVSLVVRTPPGAAADPALIPLVGNFGAARARRADVPALIAAHPDWKFDWAPGRHLLLDRARVWTRAADYRQATGATGRGVVVGIVDSGVDVMHPDFRDADGKSRVARFLDFSRPPAGFETELERVYGCQKNDDCAVYTGQDIDALIANGVNGDEPQDSVGHGTHVASLAAGGGRADPRYVGIAPEATLIVARVTGPGGTVQDSAILRAVRFVFEQADSLGMPAVVNLSLGSDFGGHDGAAPLETGLEAFVGPAAPGHAIVVAAGNSASLLRQLSSDYPAPFGIHTEVHVPRESSVRVPILSPPLLSSTTTATIFAWTSFRAGDAVSVGFEDSSQVILAPVAPGRTAEVTHGSLTVTLYNGGSGSDVDPSQRNAAVVKIDGQWPSGSVFALRFEGHGTAEMWLQSEGDLAPESAGIGAVLPRASKEETVNVPASAPGLIAVGASTNRQDWTDVAGENVRMTDNGALAVSPPDSIAFFSSGGPNAIGSIKPDIVAPGYHVVGALSALADPRTNPNSVFSGVGVCAPFGNLCMVVSDRYAVAAGTSMATPIVSGAVALLLERDPALTEPRIRNLLQAGARRLAGVVFDTTQAGPGALDLEGTRRVLESSSAVPRLPAPGASWLTLSTRLIRPDPAWAVEGLVTLRDADGLPAGGFDAARLTLDVEGVSIAKPLARRETGLYGFGLAGLPGTGQGRARVSVRFDGAIIAGSELSIGVDHAVAAHGVRVRGGCAIGVGRPDAWHNVAAVVALAGMLWLRRRRRYWLDGSGSAGARELASCSTAWSARSTASVFGASDPARSSAARRSDAAAPAARSDCS